MPDVTQGPIDLRPILADDIGAARQHIGDLLREVKATDGHRSAVLHALAAVAAATDVLIDLGAGGAALQQLRFWAARLEERLPHDVVNPPKDTLQ